MFNKFDGVCLFYCIRMIHPRLQAKNISIFFVEMEKKLSSEDTHPKRFTLIVWKFYLMVYPSKY